MNSLTRVAFAGVACGLAALLMIATAPMTGANAGAIGFLMDRTLGSSWQVIPIFTLVPFLIVFIIYTCLISIGMYILLNSSDNAPYPPLDENGRPMKACFGRHTPFHWIRQSDHKTPPIPVRKG